VTVPFTLEGPLELLSSARFSVSRRGYAKEEVDAFVAALATVLGDAREQVVHAQNAEIKKVTEFAQSAVQAELERAQADADRLREDAATDRAAAATARAEAELDRQRLQEERDALQREIIQLRDATSEAEDSRDRAEAERRAVEVVREELQIERRRYVAMRRESRSAEARTQRARANLLVQAREEIEARLAAIEAERADERASVRQRLTDQLSTLVDAIDLDEVLGAPPVGPDDDEDHDERPMAHPAGLIAPTLDGSDEVHPDVATERAADDDGDATVLPIERAST
jgi:DivIVA domain-containing protein